MESPYRWNKSFNFFLGLIEQLRKEQQDFNVWIPMLPSSSFMSKVDWVITGHNETKRKYFDGLRKCCVGVNGEQSYGGWSIAQQMEICVEYHTSNMITIITEN